MNKTINRKSFIENAIKAISVAGWAALISKSFYDLFSETPVNTVFGEYPPDSKLKAVKVSNPDAPRPNIILINCDDLGYGDIECYGGRTIRTPNINSLARDGIRFTDYYSCNAICAPSRAGLLTGRYPFRTGIIGNPYPKDEPFAKRLARRLGVVLLGLGVVDLREKYVARGISHKEITIPEALKAAGYRTGMVGKWHLGDFSKEPDYNPRRHGFDEYFGVPHSNDMSPCPLYHNEKELEADIETNQARLTGLYTRRAEKFINESGKKPFFLYFAHTFPHQPLYASNRFKNKSKGGEFGDTVEEIDWSVGRLTQLLRKKNLYNNTIIIFTSDNGPWFEGSPGSFRGRKGQSYEGGFRVPFIVRWPGRISAGRICREPAINLDIFPTLLELAGVGLPRDRIIDGKNIYSLLAGKTDKSPHENILFYHYDLLEGIRSGRWKYFRKTNRYTWPVALDTAYIPNKLGGDQLGNRWPLLYDLAGDPGESYNVLNKYPDIAGLMHKKILDWERKTKKNPRGFLTK